MWSVQQPDLVKAGGAGGGGGGPGAEILTIRQAEQGPLGILA